MWELLKKADIDEAKKELKLRRAGILRRQADEIQKLEDDRVEVETLNQLVDIFVQKFTKPPIVSHAPISPPAQNAGSGKTAAEARHHNPRDQTVFGTFVRASHR